MRRYMKVDWLHDIEDEPSMLYSEVIDGEETRKVELYRDGRMDYAYEDVEIGSTQLSSVLMPTVEEINQQAEFASVEISPDDFEDVWRRATSSRDSSTT
jgi:hypothetical protein